LNKIISNHTEDKFSSRCAANKIKSYSYLSELLVFLDLKRCNKHDEFLDIGQCLFNITDGNKEGLSFWEDISKNIRNNVKRSVDIPSKKKSLLLICRYFLQQNLQS